MENAVSIQRTPDLIAAEINSIKSQTRIMVLCNSIEIGRRLVEAKSMLEHGQWGTWLENSVEYSKSTANNLMRIFEEYGANQLSIFGDNVKFQALGILTYTQAVALLGIPAEEREQFVKDNDIDNISTRELQQAVKERDRVRQEKIELEQKLKTAEKKAEESKVHLDNASESYKRLEEVNHKHYERAGQLENELAETKKQLVEAQAAGNDEEIGRLSESLANTENELAVSKKKIEDLERQLKEKPIETTATIEKIPEEVEKELQELRKDKQLTKFRVYFDDLVNGFKDLLGALAEISDQEEQEKYKGAVKVLVSRMTERL